MKQNKKSKTKPTNKTEITEMTEITEKIEITEIKKILIFISKTIFILTFIISLYYISISKYTSPPYITSWISDYLEYKTELAKDITEQKIIILSGSNGLYGISAEKIENTTNIPTINFATCATLRGYIFERAKRILNPNDIVIMPLEYTYFFGTNNKIAFTTQSLEYRYLYARDKNFFNNKSLAFKINGRLIGLNDLIFNIRYHNKEPNEGYHIQFMNDNGDFINNIEKQNFTQIILGFPNYFNLLLNSPFKIYQNKDLNNFIDWTKNNNITLIATYPSILCDNTYKTKKFQNYFTTIQDYYKSKNLTTIGDPYDFCYENIDLFYNTDYHLNINGKKIRTDFIIKELSEIIK